MNKFANVRAGSHSARRACIYLLGLAAMSLAETAFAAAPDTIYYDGNVVTVDSGFSVQQAFAIEGDHFTAVGSNATVRRLAGTATRLVDLHGATVIPGLTDSHDHMFGIQRLMRGVDLYGAKSTTEILRRLSVRLATTPSTETVYGSTGWAAPLTRQDLDSLSATTPIVVFRFRRGLALMNSAALAKLGVTKANPTFMGAKFPVDAIGEPTGEMGPWPFGLIAMNTVVPPSNAAEEEQMIVTAQKQRNALGVTSIRDSDNQPSWLAAYFRVWRKRKLTLRVSLGLDIANIADPLPSIRDQIVGTGVGDHWLRIDSIGEEPQPAEMSREKFIAFARGANDLGWNISPHVSTTEIETAILAYEAADRDHPIKEQRWIIEHVATITPSQMDRLAKLGVVVSIQSIIDRIYNYAVKTDGVEGAGRMFPVRELIDHGITVVSGSDICCQGPDSDTVNSPWIRLHFYVTRKMPDGRVVGPQEKISRAEALRLATLNAAYATHEDAVKGSIEAGKLADFLILSDNYLTVPDDEILKLHPLATFVGGQKVYSAPEAAIRH